MQIALAPCSPFSVTGELMVGAAELARKHGARLHTHLCETMDEEAFCLEKFGRRPVDYIEDLGWLGPDVWFAHSVWPSPADIAKFAATGTSVAHCPTSNARLGSGIAPVADMLAAGVSVGLGVDGSASNESGRLDDELHQALLVARLRGGSTSMSARQVLSMATIGGAAVLGRQNDLGSLEVGKLADIALWRVDTIAGADIADPVATLVFGTRSPLELVLVGGSPVVESGRWSTPTRRLSAGRPAPRPARSPAGPAAERRSRPGQVIHAHRLAHPVQGLVGQRVRLRGAVEQHSVQIAGVGQQLATAATQRPQRFVDTSDGQRLERSPSPACADLVGNSLRASDR